VYDYTVGTVFAVLVADDTHAVGTEAATPALRSVFSCYFAGVDHGVVAGIADVVVAFVAGVAVEACV